MVTDPQCNGADVLWKLSVCSTGHVSYVIISLSNSPWTVRANVLGNKPKNHTVECEGYFNSTKETQVQINEGPD